MTDPKTPQDIDPRTETPGSLPQERVEDRPAVSTVKPDDYPAKDRNNANPAKP